MGNREKPRKSKSSYISLLVIPSPTSEVKNLKIPSWVPKAAALVGAILLLAVSLTAAHYVRGYYKLLDETDRLEAFKNIYRVQQQKIQEIEENAVRIETKIKEVDETDQRVRKLMGIESKGSTDERRNISSRGGGLEARDLIRGRGGADEAGDTVEISSFSRLDDLTQIYLYFDDKLVEERERLAHLEEEVRGHLDYLDSYPDQWPVRGRITSDFGYRKSPFGRRTEFHNGLDIAGGRGNPIHAAGKGKVIRAGYEPGYGKTVVINHGYGYMTLYAHCSKILVDVGDQIEKGDTVAKIGSTGRSTGPHLHFTVTYNGEAVDPLTVLE
ncbi:MAG: M23 family metallopeptidase [Clostridia bacterium]|nr:M23 family metallopeptidase [Clostridia bacterium]